MAAETFLIILALTALIFASASDLKKREVPNWLSFSLIVFALIYRAFCSVLSYDLRFFLNGLIGLGIFFLFGYLLYYGRVFAGGDAKLLMALGAVLFIASSFTENIAISALFIFLLLFTGSIYGTLYSIFLVVPKRKEFYLEYKKQLASKKYLVVFSLVLFVFAYAIVYFSELIFAVFPVFILLLPFLYVYAKAIEESCLIKETNVKDVTVGDWLYEEVRIGKRKIKPYWEGLNEEELKIIRIYKKKVKIKQGIPFIPVFLIAFIVLVYLWYSSWSFFKFLGF